MTKDNDKPEAENKNKNSRRNFLKNSVGAAVATGAVVTGSATNAHTAGLKNMKPQTFGFSSRIEPEALTQKNINLISNELAKVLAREASLALEKGIEPDNFHIRFGGGHSREFSRTSEHKNVIHSRIVIAGSGDI